MNLQRKSYATRTLFEAPLLVDVKELYELEEDFQNPLPVHNFVRDFIRVWDVRYARLALFLESGGRKAAIDAVLSVKAASTMVGAVRLASLAVQLEHLVKTDQMIAARTSLPELETCARQTFEELERTYLGPDNWC